jgi:hypothetical protein
MLNDYFFKRLYPLLSFLFDKNTLKQMYVENALKNGNTNLCNLTSQLVTFNDKFSRLVRLVICQRVVC